MARHFSHELQLRRPPRLTSFAATSNTVERHQKLFRDNELAAQVFHDVTTRLAELLELNIAQQRLDSTHVFSHMARFGRIKLMAVAIQATCSRVVRGASRSVPPPLPTGRVATVRRGQAEDSPYADMTGRSSYKAMVTIFSQECELIW